MTTRVATTGDVAAVTHLWNDIIRDTLVTFNSVEKSHDDIRQMIEGEQARVFVAEEAGEVVGFATYAQFRHGVGYAHTMEHSVHLDPDARGRGLGRALMAMLEEDAASRGAHSMFAGVSGANPAGVAFHEALGFRHIATLPEVGFKWGRWLDLHLMQKRLSQLQGKG